MMMQNVFLYDANYTSVLCIKYFSKFNYLRKHQECSELMWNVLESPVYKEYNPNPKLQYLNSSLKLNKLA